MSFVHLKNYVLIKLATPERSADGSESRRDWDCLRGAQCSLGSDDLREHSRPCVDFGCNEHSATEGEYVILYRMLRPTTRLFLMVGTYKMP